MSFLKGYLNKLLENQNEKIVLENSKQYKVDSHFERDRAYVSIEDLNGKEIATWWDDDVRELIDDGFLNPKDLQGSAIEYARHLGLIESKEDTKPLWVLYVGKKGSGTLHPQFSDYSRKIVADEYNYSWKNDHDDNGNRIKYSHKIIKVNAGETQPKSLTESTDLTEARVRKTEDEYSLYGDYGHGWELLTTASTFTEIRANRKDYRENEPGVPLKIVKKRVKKVNQ